MDRRLLAYGIFYSHTEFAVWSFLPCLQRPPEGEERTSSSFWIFERFPAMRFAWHDVGEASEWQRKQVINAVLAIEQRTYELNRLIKDLDRQPVYV